MKLYNKTYAIFIGIDRYEDAEIPRLKNAVNDARGIKKVLEQRYRFDEYKELYDEKATQKSIMEYFQDELADKVGEDDAVFVFWAGHGTQQENTRYGDLGYLIPYDGSLKKHSRNISMETLKTNISKSLKARHVFYVMDACYGGLMTDKRAIQQQTNRDLTALRQLAKEDVRQVLTAGSKGETVLDGINGHSVFTGRLIEILEAQNDFITANEIQAIITRNVTSDALKLEHSQTPQYGKLYGQGDFVFVPSRDYRMQQLKAEQDQRQADIDKSIKEQDKLKKEMEELAALEQKAKDASNDRERRKAEDARRVAEAKLAQERLRLQALENEKKRKAEEEADLRRIDDERKRQLEEARQMEARFRQEDERRQVDMQRFEQEQLKKKQEEEQKLTDMRKIAEERRRKTLETASSSLSVEAAVAEIKSADTKVAEITQEFDTELKRQKANAAVRLDEKLKLLKESYDPRMAALAQQKPVSIPKPTIAPKDEFETQAEYQARVAKAEKDYQQRVTDAAAAGGKARQAEEDAYNQAVKQAKEKHRDEMAELETRTAAERDLQIKPFKERLAAIANQEYTLLPDSLVLDLGQYDPDNQRFPVSIKSRVESGVRVAVNGAIPLPKEAARKFKQEWQNGLVRPEMTVRAGDIQITRMAIINDADNQRLVDDEGDFITVEMKAKRVEESQKTGFRFTKDTALDVKTGLMWTRDGNMAGKQMNWNDAGDYCQKLNLGGHNDWRLPTKEELAALSQYGKNAGYGNKIADYFNGIGFRNVEHFGYWSSTTYAYYPGHAWYVYFDDGFVGSYGKGNHGMYVRCVRGGQ